ncbi:unnamed protein product [Adineta ricciae]|uniref:Uncharacterized protein n=1 Tax=Adineta ricciae TaxID=249248 RepID=A0A814RQ06_ADIRI|nr:unnamed protein product [Adineta ricciae]
MDYIRQLILIILFLASQNTLITRGCSVIRIVTPDELIQQAYTVVRARAVDYERPPNALGIGIIRFAVEEVIKGNTIIPNPLRIEGTLNQYDDFNDRRVPYNLVRPGGRMGSCFARSYKQNGNFLLFLNRQYAPYWSALAPVNEQLHMSPTVDPWLQWVKDRVKSMANNRPSNQFLTSGAAKSRSFFL